MKQVDVLILSWHQVYLSSNAGGYIRLKEFLKRIPKPLSFLLIDNSPTIYKDIVPSANLVTYDTPGFLKKLRQYAFLPWLLLETIFAGVIIYRNSKKLIESKKIKIVYVPIGEFHQLYIPGVFLKRKFPHIKLVVDILNYELPESDWFSYFKKLQKSGVGLLRSFITIIMFSIGYFLTNITLPATDYIFTVSPELVKKIKKAYKKNTIDFTPSGVDTKRAVVAKKKKYLGVYIGRITTQKGIMELIATWTEVVRKKKDAILAIAGHADETLLINLKKEIKKKKLTNNIKFFGQVTEKEKFGLLSESEMFLHLARYEPLFPVIGILEGLASGLYTIVYNMPVVSSQKKQLQKEESLAIVENGNIEEVTKQILSFSSLQTAKKQKIDKAARKFAKFYDWDIIAKKEFNVITKLARQSH